MKKKIIFHFIIILLAMSTTGCISLGGQKGPAAVDGGVFKTLNKGTTWAQKSLVPSVSGRALSFGAANVATMEMDPADEKALYYSSIGNGLFFTYDSGETWQKANPLGNAVVRDIAIDPKFKCTVYAANGNRLLKTEDCSRSWLQVYFDNELTATVDAIAIDHYNTENVFIGISRGDLVMSEDRGISWRTIHRFNDRVLDLAIDPNDSRAMYAIMQKQGLYRSEDGGVSWVEMNDILKELKLGFNIKNIIFIPDQPGTIYLVLDYGILKSADQGQNWEQIEIIPPEKKAFINDVAVNPANPSELYYVTNTTFNRSVDGGQNWAPFKLPTTRAGWELIIDPKNPSILYLGARALQ